MICPEIPWYNVQHSWGTWHGTLCVLIGVFVGLYFGYGYGAGWPTKKR